MRTSTSRWYLHGKVLITISINNLLKSGRVICICTCSFLRGDVWEYINYFVSILFAGWVSELPVREETVMNIIPRRKYSEFILPTTDSCKKVVIVLDVFSAQEAYAP